jgi:hypothetical protein
VAYSVSDSAGGFDNSGIFKRVCNWVADKNAGIKILAERMDDECDNFAAGFNNCITRDMKGKPYTNFDFNTYRGINMATELSESGDAVNVQTMITDPTRLFYDVSIVANEIWLQNGYMNTPAVNELEGYHFLFVCKNTMSIPDFKMRFYNTYMMYNMPVVGPDGAPITPPLISSRNIYSCVIYRDSFLTPELLKVCILNAIPSGGSGGGGGKVDTITSLDEYLDVNDDDQANVKLSIDTDELDDNLNFVQTITTATADTINITNTDAKNPQLDLNIEHTAYYLTHGQGSGYNMPYIPTYDKIASISIPMMNLTTVFTNPQNYFGNLSLTGSKTVVLTGDQYSIDFIIPINFSCIAMTMVRDEATITNPYNSFTSLSIYGGRGIYTLDGFRTTKLQLGTDFGRTEMPTDCTYILKNFHFGPNGSDTQWNITAPVIYATGPRTVVRVLSTTSLALGKPNGGIPLVYAANGAKIIFEGGTPQFPNLSTGDGVFNCYNGGQIIMASTPNGAVDANFASGDKTSYIICEGRFRQPRSF